MLFLSLNVKERIVFFWSNERIVIYNYILEEYYRNKVIMLEMHIKIQTEMEKQVDKETLPE